MKWIESPQLQPPAELLAGVGGHPLVAQLLTLRGFSDLPSAQAFLDPRQYHPSPGREIPGMSDAVDLLEQAIKGEKKICVWGDFDVDGQTSTTLLVSALRQLGGKVTFHIPNRERESHGISLSPLEEEMENGIDLLLTCDTGISANETIEHARQYGVDVVITDHHDLPEKLPDANAIVNPKRLPPNHALASLPGVGVAYKLAQELFNRLKPDHVPDDLLDLVALGIVADVAVQSRDVRYLLQRGLAALRVTGRLGLKTMMSFSNLVPESLTEEHIAFTLAPRLNALGRLSDTNIIVDFLTTSDPDLAQSVNLKLEEWNNQRKLLTEQVLKGALSLIERDPSLRRHASLVLAHPSWHGGVLGPVASRLVEIFHKPCILLRNPPGEDARGSARSVDGCDISAALRANQHFLHSYGGHPMAAGMALASEDIAAFRIAISHTIHEVTGVDEIEPTLVLDAYLDLSELTLPVLHEIERLAPFGPGNPQPVFCSRNLALSSKKVIGQDDEHLVLTVEDIAGAQTKIIHWRGAGMEIPQGRFDLAYHARTSNYRGEPEMSLQWVDARLTERTTIDLDQTGMIEVIDHRKVSHPAVILNTIGENGNILVWCEGEARQKICGADRNNLRPADKLVIWTTPPAREVLETVLDHVSPGTLHLFSIHPPSIGPQSFIGNLLGMAKHVINKKGGITDLEALAAAAAQRLATVRLGLTCLEKAGLILVDYQEDGRLHLQKGSGISERDNEKYLDQLKTALDETAAYRQHFRTADIGSLSPRFKPSTTTLNH